jgi:hypothetical protein
LDLLLAAYSLSCGTGFTSDHELTYLNIIAVPHAYSLPYQSTTHGRFKKVNTPRDADGASETDVFALEG